MEERPMTEKESLDLISQMIHKARNDFHNTGVGAIMWGCVIAICSLVKAAELQFDFRLPFDIYLLTLVAIIPQLIISVREKKERRVRSYDDAFMDYLWLAFGICIFLMVFITNTVYADLNHFTHEISGSGSTRVDWIDLHFSEYVSSLFLLLYGLPTFVTGAACRFRPMLFGGLLCWTCCLVSLYTPIKIDLLLTACSALLAWLVPGIQMEQHYRREKKRLEANV
jgi:uncharacterized protein with PQ loop repeat